MDSFAVMIKISDMVNDHLYEQMDMGNQASITTVIARSIAMRCDVVTEGNPFRGNLPVSTNDLYNVR